MLLLWALLIFEQGGGHTKIDCHANNANCDTVAVLIPFQIFVLSAVQSFSKTEWYCYWKKPKMCFFMYRCYFFCIQLYIFGQTECGSRKIRWYGLSLFLLVIKGSSAKHVYKKKQTGFNGRALVHSATQREMQHKSQGIQILSNAVQGPSFLW